MDTPAQSQVTMDRLLKLPAVRDLTGLGRTSLLDQVREGTFPSPVRIGPRAVCWRLSEVQAWIASRPSARPDVVKPAA